MAEIPVGESLSTIPEESEKTQKPKSRNGVYFVFAHILPERFSFFSLQVVLDYYVARQINQSDLTAKLIYYGYLILEAIFTLFSGIVADVWLGRYWTIIGATTIYCIGGLLFLIVTSVITSTTAVKLPFLCISVVFLAIGGAGYKCNIIPFGADQFIDRTEKQRNQFFAINYWLVNLVAIIAYIITPYIKRVVNCFDDDGCDTLLFSIAAFVTIVGLVVFSFGQRFYIRLAPSRKLLKEIFAVSRYANQQRKKAKKNLESRTHWLDYADDKFSYRLIEDVKCIYAVSKLLITAPIFWAVFSQQNSLWIIQASYLDGRLGDFEIDPYFLLFFNPILALILIPIFEFWIYPSLAKCYILMKPLPRMYTGGFVVAVAFLMSAILQVFIELELPHKPSPGHIDLMVVSDIPCQINFIVNTESAKLDQYDYHTFSDVKIKGELFVKVEPSKDCSYKSSQQELWIKEKDKAYTLVIWYEESDLKLELRSRLTEQKRERDPDGNTQIRFLYMGKLPFPDSELLLIQGDNIISMHFNMNATNYISVQPKILCEICWGTTTCKDKKKETSCKKYCDDQHKLQKFRTYKGGIFDIFFVYHNASKIGEIEFLQIVPENHFHILFQIPQYFFETIAEVMYTVTAFQFIYAQVPYRMKSLTFSVFFFTMPIGQLISPLINLIFTLAKVRESYWVYFSFLFLIFSFAWLLVAFTAYYLYRKHEAPKI